MLPPPSPLPVTPAVTALYIESSNECYLTHSSLISLSPLILIEFIAYCSIRSSLDHALMKNYPSIPSVSRLLLFPVKMIQEAVVLI